MPSKVMKFDIPPARESRLRMAPGTRVLGPVVLEVVRESAIMTPSGAPRVEAMPGVQLSLFVDQPDCEPDKKIPRRLFLLGIGEEVPGIGDQFACLGVVSMGPAAFALYLEAEFHALVAP